MLVNLLQKLNVSLNNILKLNNADNFKNLMIVAHPDDEILWGGGHLCIDKYFVVCLTNGHNFKRSNDFRKIIEFSKNGGIILDYPDNIINVIGIYGGCSDLNGASVLLKLLQMVENT